MALPGASRLEMAAVLARRGFLRPVRPDRLVRAGLALRRHGPTVGTAFIVSAVTRPDHPAVIDDHRTLTFAEVDRRTNSLARGLRALGLGPGDRLAILCRNGAPFVESVVAAAKLGADALPLNTSFAPAEVSAIVERERPPVLICDEGLRDLTVGVSPSVARVMAGAAGAAGPSLEDLATAGDHRPLDPPAEEGRVIILTSGTTGAPKGARVGRPEGLEPLAWFLSTVPLHTESAALIAAPLFHAHGFGQFVIAASMGCTLVLTDRFDPRRTLELIERHRVQSVAAVPVMLKRIMELPTAERRRDTSSLRAVVCSGSTLDPGLARSFMEQFGPVLYNLYGSTEVSWATIATPQDLLAAPGTVGRPPPHTRVVVLDEHDRSLGPGEVGRIFVGSDMLFEGYTHDAPSTAPARDMLSPGDLGHLDAEGRLFVDAREDDMIVSGGENVYPGEVEQVLAAHPQVDEVAVVGVDDEQFGQRLVAFVVPHTGSDLTGDAVARYAREHLARFKVPRSIELLDELPRNALGKVLHRELRQTAGGL